MSSRDTEIECLRTLTSGETTGQPPLFCLPGAGGTASIFREMVATLDADLPVYGIDAQKFFEIDRHFTVEELADLCLSTIREKQPHGPYFLCGYSFGAIVAYEVATKFASMGADVGLVALIDTGNPAFRGQLSSAKERQLKRSYLADRLGKYFNVLIGGEIRKLAGGIAAVLAAHAGIGTRRLVRGMFRAFDRPMPDILRNNDRTMFDAWRAYDPPKSAIPLLLFCGKNRPSEYGGDQTLGWGVCTSANVDVELTTAEHVEMMQSSHVRGFATKLGAYMKKGRSVQTAP